MGTEIKCRGLIKGHAEELVIHRDDRSIKLREEKYSEWGAR